MRVLQDHGLIYCILIPTAVFKSADIMNVNLAFSENRIKIPSSYINPNKSIALKNQTALSVL